MQGIKGRLRMILKRGKECISIRMGIYSKELTKMIWGMERVPLNIAMAHCMISCNNRFEGKYIKDLAEGQGTYTHKDGSK